MNEELLELAIQFKKLEDKGKSISSIIQDLSSEFAELERVSVRELLYKLYYL